MSGNDYKDDYYATSGGTGPPDDEHLGSGFFAIYGPLCEQSMAFGSCFHVSCLDVAPAYDGTDVEDGGVDRGDIVCAHEANPCSPIAGDCLCRCSGCSERRGECELTAAILVGPIGPQCADFDARGYCGHGTTPMGDASSCIKIEDTVYSIYMDAQSHDCAYQTFLDDPITRAYGAQDCISLVSCKVCDADSPGE